MYHRIKLTYYVRFKNAFHCGTGLAKGIIDRTVARDKNELLYIPGSTIKGVLREQCERLAQLFDISVHPPHDPLPTPVIREEVVPWFREGPDIIEQIFGSQKHEGSLFFDNAWMIENDKKFFQPDPDEKNEKRKRRLLRLQTSTRTQTRLARLTKTVKENALYTSEFGIPEITFAGKIHGGLDGTPNEMVDLPGSYPLFLLIAGLGMIERIGANRSTGMGACRFEIQEIVVDEQCVQPVEIKDEGGKMIIETKTPYQQYCEALETFLVYQDARRES